MSRELMVTAPKFNMDAENDGETKRNLLFQKLIDLQVPCLNFKGVSSILITIL